MQTTPARPPLKYLIFMSLATLIFITAIIMIASGHANWVEGWLFALWMVTMIMANFIYLYFKNPDLLAERSKAPGSGNQKPWDKFIQGGAYFGAVLWMVVIPLDSSRFGWSPAFPLWLKITGGLMLLPALFFLQRATMDNNFLSAAVRLQSDRGQQVVSSGVYGFVRHPLYLGVLLMLIGAPLMTGSLCGLGIGLIAMAVLVYRILGEEKMMMTELEGYAEYKQKVKYRLIPFVW
jgi:protein-S-isoprenylcysteine O-methyltransferase Ste14